jgi:hypothetical protein
MCKSICQILISILTMALSGLSAATEVAREEALELMEEFQTQCAENIAPLREQAIAGCVSNGRRDQEYCERFNRTFGNARPREGGGMIPGMFWALPVCEHAVAAERFFRMNPSRQVFTLPWGLESPLMR